MPRSAAFFDVDGTICATRSTTSLVWLRRQQHSGARHLLWLASAAWRAPLAWATDHASRAAADRMVYAQFAGLSLQRLEADARRCCDEVLLPACLPGALAEIEMQRAAGRRIVLVSGGLDVVLAPLAAALDAELLAQSLVVEGDRCTGVHRTYALLGEDATPPSHAEAKAAAVRRYAAQAGMDLSASAAYGDSINDLAMLETVGSPAAVCPDRRLRRVAAERGWPIRDWSVA